MLLCCNDFALPFITSFLFRFPFSCYYIVCHILLKRQLKHSHSLNCVTFPIGITMAEILSPKLLLFVKLNKCEKFRHVLMYESQFKPRLKIKHFSVGVNEMEKAKREEKSKKKHWADCFISFFEADSSERFIVGFGFFFRPSLIQTYLIQASFNGGHVCTLSNNGELEYAQTPSKYKTAMSI